MITEQSLCSPKQYGALEVTTEEQYWEMLECVPPAHMHRGAFAVGEAYADRWQFGGEFPDEDAHLVVYDCYWQTGTEAAPVFLHGFFTIKDYLAMTHERLQQAIVLGQDAKTTEERAVLGPVLVDLVCLEQDCGTTRIEKTGWIATYCPYCGGQAKQVNGSE